MDSDNSSRVAAFNAGTVKSKRSRRKFTNYSGVFPSCRGAVVAGGKLPQSVHCGRRLSNESISWLILILGGDRPLIDLDYTNISDVANDAAG